MQDAALELSVDRIGDQILQAAGALERNLQFLADASGTGRHDQHAIGQEQGLINIVGYEKNGGPSGLPDARADTTNAALSEVGRNVTVVLALY